jgi:RNA polymerase sigma-32 factor
MEAVARFEPRRGVRFASYATWWIRAYLLKSLIDNARVVRAGRSRQDRRAFFQGTAPPREVPLDVPLADGPDAEPVGRSLADGRVAPVDQRLEMLELASVLRARARAFQQRLRPREAAVFAERVLSDEETPRHRLARRFSVSKERIRQIEKDLVGRFRLEAEAA